ncbi:tetratricopeptide repeat protein [Pelagicoccus mobilis]|uniref:Tetratricopeptide repeat protein n=1 Tax=Pelagicoccus mobilis TaxID=415221 RepID=A0A934S7J7_9BACT|nr:tetratricopeptide repeat protein [Pelagicoccus mobilis]MBK1880353.1 tetratricopeptide repeat protein [Pelagicoccus mobilis]
MAKQNSSKNAPKKDERNIVGPDQVEIQDLEDSAIMFWEKYKSTILASVAFIFAVFLGYQGLKFMQARAEKQLQDGYAAANDSDAKAAWAADESGEALSGFAFKELGDEAFEAGDYSKAEGYYREAVEATEAPVDEAATVALAVVLIAQDKTDEAKGLLQPIADNPAAFAQAEAQYRLAYLASEEGDAVTARSLIEAIDEQAFFWKTRAQAIEQKLPEA